MGEEQEDVKKERSGEECSLCERERRTRACEREKEVLSSVEN